MMNNNSRKIIYAIGLVFIILIVWGVAGLIGRVGKTEVTINVAPGAAKVTINESSAKGGVNYLTPGTYKISASFNGFNSVSKEVEVSSNPINVDLLLKPTSEEGFNYLNNNPSARKAYENMTSTIAANTGNAQRKTNPIVSELPHTDLIGPFSIDYGPDQNRGDGGVLLIVSDSTAPGRYEAQQWIKGQGQNLSEVNIVYFDFVNPLRDSGGESAH